MITVYKENGKVDIGGSIKLTLCFLVGVIIAGFLVFFLVRRFRGKEGA